MPDSRRLGTAQNAHTSTRDSRTEALLVDGLERYFNADYEEAIHLWTRVLFLDRSHARARAYIDRARTSLAERQRRVDEILHATDESLAQGDADRARALLSEAEANFGDDERAAGLRLRLERLERLRVGFGEPLPREQPSEAGIASRQRGRVWWAGAGLVGGLLLVAALSDGLLRSIGLSDTPPEPRPSGALATPALLSSSEVALIRARTLVSRGRLAEALRVLQGVDPDSDESDAAEALRLRIQQLLLATSGVPGPAVPESGGLP
jgi:hypothetical protein